MAAAVKLSKLKYGMHVISDEFDHSKHLTMKLHLTTLTYRIKMTLRKSQLF
jgi:hypothetical protein